MSKFKANEHHYQVGDGPTNYIVWFIGSGYEAVCELRFKGVDGENVFELAKQWYEETNQTFYYCNEFERREYREPTNPVYPINTTYIDLREEEA